MTLKTIRGTILFKIPANAIHPFSITILSLSEAIQRAVHNNPQLEFAQQKISAAEHSVTQSKSGYYPQINFSEKFNRTNNPMWAFGTKLNQSRIRQQDFNPDLLNDPEQVKAMADKNYAIAQDNFSLEVLECKLKEVLSSF